MLRGLKYTDAKHTFFIDALSVLQMVQLVTQTEREKASSKEKTTLEALAAETAQSPYKIKNLRDGKSSGYFKATSRLNTLSKAKLPISYLKMGKYLIRRGGASGTPRRVGGSAAYLMHSSNIANRPNWNPPEKDPFLPQNLKTPIDQLGEDRTPLQDYEHAIEHSQLRDKIAVLERNLSPASIAGLVRTALNGQEIPANDTRAKEYYGSVIPALAAALYIAEPLCNPRAFLVNLMFLDLVEAEVTYGATGKQYTWRKSLWQPEQENDRRWKSLWQQGPKNDSKQWLANSRQDADVPGEPTYLERRSDLQLAGGRLPAAMTGSATTKWASMLHPESNYMQRTEVTITARWLLAKLEKKKKQGWESVHWDDAIHDNWLRPDMPAAPAKATKPLAEPVKGLYEILETRIRSLKFQLARAG